MELLEKFRKESETLCMLKNSSRVLGWDQQIMMPRTTAATQVRGRQQAILSRVAHERLVSQEFGDLLKAVADHLGQDGESDDALALARWQRERRRSTAVSADLVEELSIAATCSRAPRSGRRA